jgi:retinol-binding protein 3
MKCKSLLLIFIFVLTLSAQAQDNGAKMNTKEIKLLVDSLSSALKRWYIYRDKAELISKAIKDKYKTGAYNKIQNGRELADMIQADLQKVHRDLHMRIMYFPDLEKRILTVLPDSLQKKEEEMELNNERSRNFYFTKAEIMPGNIGYIRWDAFVGHTKEAQPTYEASFKFVSNAKALIIDMRYNAGGLPYTVNAMLNYFFDKKLPMNHNIGNKHDTVKHYTDPSVTPFKLIMPIYVLTSKRTISGAEDFTYAMKYAKRAIIVGDTTSGAAHATAPFPLGQGFVMNIPVARSYHEVTGANWEGTGVFPDVDVKGENALEKAQLLIFKYFLAKANNDREKREAQGQIIAVENKLTLAQNGSMNFSNEQLQKFCGEYKPVPGPGATPNGIFIILKGSNLFRNIPFPPDWKLIPISNTRFVYDNDDANRYLDFTMDKEGNPSGLTIYYTDGRTFSYEKVK